MWPFKSQQPAPSLETEDTFCIKPFVELDVTPLGTVRPCCAVKFYSKDKQPLSVYESTIKELWTSDSARNLRKKMVQNEELPECNYCFKHEKIAGSSLRLDILKSWKNGYLNPDGRTVADVKSEAIKTDYKMSRGPEWIDLEVGNLCNLKCRMCTSFSSSSIASDPVQSRWSFGTDFKLPRWRGKTLSIAPHPTVGVEYAGDLVHSSDNSGPVLRCAAKGALTFKTPDTSLCGAELTFSSSGNEASSVTLLANGEVILQSTVGNSREIQKTIIPERIAKSPTITFAIESSKPINIHGFNLTRELSGSNSVAFNRMPEGRQWFQSEQFLKDDLLYDVEALKKVAIIGGEPLLIKETLVILQHLIDRGASSQITLNLTTNGTIYSEEIAGLLTKFRSVSLGVSVDGYGEVNDYIRAPSKWDDIEANILRFRDLKNVYLYLNQTIQAYNLLHIAPLARWCEEQDVGFIPHFLDQPKLLHWLTMPVEARQLAAERLRQFILRNDKGEETPTSHRINEVIQQLITTIAASDAPHDHTNLRDFITYTNDIDVSRGQDFASINSELMEIIEEHGMKWFSTTRFAKMKNQATASST